MIEKDSKFDQRYFVETGERLARIETLVKTLVDRKPCYECKNEGLLVRLNQNIKFINWAGGLSIATGIVYCVNWVLRHAVSDGKTFPF